MGVYERLVSIAAEHAAAGYLAHYERDLHVHDKGTLAAYPGVEWVWLLRSHGTALFPVGVGHNPAWVTYWLDHDGNPAPLAFRILGDRVEPIDHTKARRLAWYPASKAAPFPEFPVGWRRPVMVGARPCGI